MTGLEHADRIAATPSGSWIVAGVDTTGAPQKGGTLRIPAGTRARIRMFIGLLNIKLETGKSVSLFKDDFGDLEIAK
jgi:hypothetical protein